METEREKINGRPSTNIERKTKHKAGIMNELTRGKHLSNKLGQIDTYHEGMRARHEKRRTRREWMLGRVYLYQVRD